ncbi:hypothetical protein ABZ721_14800 [Streptomyces sp. NPDC006733]|uniref:hypothetical protein n=1 Tax=Streptomyces sp. NPDC006733 TaxID=3155460 RepID=UPI0033E85296
MTERSTIVRSLHDLGLAIWFGGSLMGSVGLNGAAEEVGGPPSRDPDQATSEVQAPMGAKIASTGWRKWTPYNAGAIVVHLVGGAALLRDNADRVRNQQGVTTSTVVKTVVTGAALAATAYTRILGKKVELATSEDKEDRVRAEEHPISLEQAQRQLRLVQWSVPALTGALVVLNALHGEQQRPSVQGLGRLQKVMSRRQ